MYQLALELSPPADLTARLRAAGLPPDISVVPHSNRRVLVSLTRGSVLRVHAGYRAAPEPVLAAIVRWARPRLRRADRLLAARILMSFPVHDHADPALPPRRRPRAAPEPGDDLRLERLRALHTEYNALHFGGTLGQCDLRISSRMRRRLGEFRPAAFSHAAEIAISRSHLRGDGWTRVAGTLLHEMVHQWQAETGQRLGHGAGFRRKCAELGIPDRAVAVSFH